MARLSTLIPWACNNKKESLIIALSGTTPSFNQPLEIITQSTLLSEL